ncbi:MAG: hypothetical protein H0T43_01525 [Solirubrobacterales bacterium]|nr:hypothetical protein [Solirubrobacterales bacterium]
MTRRLVPLLLVAAALLAVPASAPAVTNVAVGIGDQSPRMFTDANYKALGLKKTRYFIHWDAITKPGELQKADTFVAAARAARVKVLMHISTNNLTARRARLPSVRQYRSAVGALVRRYKPMGVREWGVWNEANHVTQPTFRSPSRAASFYKTFRGLCGRCSIVALDVLDQKGVESYIRRWFKAAGPTGRRATIIGIHNYSEVNRRIRKGTDRYPGTARIIRAVRRAKNTRAKFWYTETGGIVNFGGAFPCNRRRPVSRNAFMFSLAKKHRTNIRRLYTYNWTGADCNGFDAGLIEANGALRPAYAPFRRSLRDFRK